MTNYLKKAWLMRFVVNPVWEVVKFVVKPVWLVLKFVWAAVKSTPAAVKDGLAATRGDMSGWDLIHFIVSAVLLARALLSLLRHWSGLPAVVAVDLYLLVLLLLAACRCYSLLPDRFTALFMALFTFAALVFGFATVFLENGCFEKRELGMNSRTKRVTVSSTNL